MGTITCGKLTGVTNERLPGFISLNDGWLKFNTNYISVKVWWIFEYGEWLTGCVNEIDYVEGVLWELLFFQLAEIEVIGKQTDSTVQSMRAA